MKEIKSGFVTIIGRPNVGKSTLLNHFVGQKIAIMSDKAQTTRNKIQAVLTLDDAQVIFIDTPGVHKPKHHLGNFMVNAAVDAIKGVDLVLVVVNANEKMGPGDLRVIDYARNSQLPVFLVINKIDLIHPDQLLSVIDGYRQEFEFTEIYPISAIQGNNTEALLEGIKNALPIGPQYYPSDQITDHPEYFVVSEFIREKILFFTREEIPHSVAVQVNRMRHNDENEMEIEATIVVERESQKGIIIGKNGALIKKVKKLARKDIENLLGEKVFLDLWVKVQKDWRNRSNQLKDLGYRPEDY